VPRSYGKAGGLETPSGARALSAMPAHVCGNGGPSILLGTSRDLSETPMETRWSFVSIHLRERLGSVRPKYRVRPLFYTCASAATQARSCGC